MSDLYNATTCAEKYTELPGCLESIEFALEKSSVESRVAAEKTCDTLLTGDLHGRIVEDIRRPVSASRHCL